MSEKKAYPLRINAQVLDAVQRWADDELRSVNAQIEYVLRDALRNRDVARCARTLDGLKAEGAALPLVLWALANEARQRAARAALLHAARIDRMIKGVAKGDVWDEFLQLALRLTRTA